MWCNLVFLYLCTAKTDIMIVHLVMWKFKESAEGCSGMENAAKVKEKLEALKGVIPGIRSLEVRLNVNRNDPMAYDAVLISRFETIEDLELYKNHPEHKKVSTLCKSVRESRATVDYIE